MTNEHRAAEAAIQSARLSATEESDMTPHERSLRNREAYAAQVTAELNAKPRARGGPYGIKIIDGYTQQMEPRTPTELDHSTPEQLLLPFVEFS